MGPMGTLVTSMCQYAAGGGMSAVCVSVWYYYSYYHYTASTKHAGSCGCIYVSIGVANPGYR